MYCPLSHSFPFVWPWTWICCFTCGVVGLWMKTQSVGVGQFSRWSLGSVPLDAEHKQPRTMPSWEQAQHTDICMWMDQDCRDPSLKKNTSYGNEVLLQDTTHLIQRPCYQWGSPCQDPGGNWPRQRPADHCKETQSAVVWSCLLFIKSGQNHLARHSETGKKTRQTEEDVGRQHQGMDRPGVRKVPRALKNTRKWSKLVVKSSAYTQRPSRLKNRWWWWWW